jgi:cytochrome c peroxidase
MQHQLQIPIQNIHAINLSKPSLFDTNAFQVDFFTPDASSAVTAQKIALGKTLFADRVLSENGTVSCVSCHLPEKAFTDGLALSRSFGAGQFLSRNTPSVLYAGLQQSQFYDMRAGFLEDQVRNVVENRDEIHGSLDEAAITMNRVPAFRSQFKEAMQTDSITAWEIQVVLAAYVRSLAPFSSRFDQHMRGKDELNRNEISGFNLFMGKAKCGTCHFMPVFNGTIPPFYTATESEVIGVPADKNFSRMSRDSGRYTIYKIPILQFAFKTPTLRNISLTAPYMHNGIFETLEEVVDFYDRGGGVGRGLKLEHQTLPETPLQLTEMEKKQLILFLKTLTDSRY